MRHRIACLGDNCVDYYDQTGDTYFGGNPVNVAVYSRRLGNDASYLGAVGTDSFGRQMKDALLERGIDVSHVQTLSGSTALTHVTLANGDRIFGDYDEGVMEAFCLRGEDFDFIHEHELAVTGLWGHCQKDLARIRELGVVTAFDCSDRPEDPAAVAAIPDTDILFFSDDTSTDEQLVQKLELLASQGPGVVVATRGVKGSMAYHKRHLYTFGILPVVVADTMGAGDSYIAGFLHAWLERKPMEICMKAGAECSAVTLAYPGAW